MFAYLLVLAATSPLAYANNPNTLPYGPKSVEGVWGFYSQGTVSSVLGRIEFLPDGKCQLNKSFNVQGQVVRYDITDTAGCNFTMDEDGVGRVNTLSHFLGNTVRIPFGTAIVERGRRVEFIRTDSVARGTGFRRF
mmetsp:Transcript_24666/g.48169  ORF Transcript_24666/g.48169 Transcript_24666/m.48169 type:complete len:136 (+) Transcript_24666:46-453(+)